MSNPVGVAIKRLEHGLGLALPAYATDGAAGTGAGSGFTFAEDLRPLAGPQAYPGGSEREPPGSGRGAQAFFRVTFTGMRV